MSEPVRVLRIQSRICIGGPALNSIYLSAHMKAPFQTLLIGGRLEPGESSLEPLAHELGVAIKVLDEMGRSVHWYDDIKALMALIKVIRYYQPHIVHTHTAKAGALGRIAAFMCRVPIRIHTFHGHVFEGYFSRFGNMLVRVTERTLAHMSTAIIAISTRQRNDLVERFRIVHTRKCHIVRLGFDLDKVSRGQRGQFRESLGLNDDVFLAGIIARLVPIKNHRLLLEALAIWRVDTKLTSSQIQFLVIGDGELRQELEDLCKQLDLQNWVRFTGWISDMPMVYADLDLNILVSKNEGTPVTLIEGLSVGVPVLTTDVGGIRDVLDDDCGTIIAADADAQTLARAISSRVYESFRLDENQRARIRQEFGVERLISDMQHLYARLINKDQVNQ